MKLTPEQIQARISGINTKELAIKLLVKLDDEIKQARSLDKINYCKAKISLLERDLAKLGNGTWTR